MMDLKYDVQDGADLSVGMTVTCSTSSEVSERYEHGFPIWMGYDSHSPAERPAPNYRQADYDRSYDYELEEPKVEREASAPPHNYSYHNYRYENNLSTQRGLDDRGEPVTFTSTRRFPSSAAAALNTNANNNNNNGAKMQVCKICGKTFKFQTSLLRHNNKVHICRYQCRVCCRVFSRQSYLDVHTGKPGTSCYVECKLVRVKRRP